MFHDLKYMQLAIEVAKQGLSKGFVPIGCVIVKDNNIISTSHNDDFWHAEILCIQKAQKTLSAKFLFDCKL